MRDDGEREVVKRRAEEQREKVTIRDRNSQRSKD